jgi:hypothetical protein
MRTGIFDAVRESSELVEGVVRVEGRLQSDRDDV